MANKDTKKPTTTAQPEKPAPVSAALGIVKDVRKSIDDEASKMAAARLEASKLTFDDLIIPGLRRLKTGGDYGASHFAVENSDFERTFVEKPIGGIFSRVCNFNTPTKTVMLSVSNLHIYKQMVLNFNKKLEDTSKMYSGLDTKSISECATRFIDALNGVLAAEPNSHGKIIEAIINSLLNNNFTNYDLTVYGINDQLNEVITNMHIPRAFGHNGDDSNSLYDYNGVKQVLGNPAYFTGYCPRYVEILSAEHYLAEAAGAYIVLNNDKTRYRNIEVLTHKRKMFVSTILHFSRSGKIDTILLGRVIMDYMTTLRNYISTAVYSIRNITKQLSEINWLTSAYLFDDYDDFLVSRLSLELTRNPAVGTKNVNDDMPF